MELIITEKPSSAKKVAEALSNSKPIKRQKGKVIWWDVTHGDKDITVVSAIGHLYGVVEDKKHTGWRYPVFDVRWQALDKKGAVSSYIAVIEKLAKQAKEFTIATDYDIEGEVIGCTILQHACHKKDGNRMKYSMVTVPALQKSYETKSKTLDWGQANAGLTRHELDWYYGINYSRALTLAVKAAGAFKLLSSGRVQGPTLKIVVDKEREIRAFVPEPYWELSLPTKIDKSDILAVCKDNPFSSEKLASKYNDACTGEATVSALDSRESQLAPPHPFDLTTLQTESYRSLRITPRETLRIAQDLYTAGYISYPRTSSQILPKELGFENILKDLSAQKDYAKYCAKLLALKNLEPNNGKKTDPAHPAIFPTGVKPLRLGTRTMSVYDLIVRRFFATFGTPAVRETQTVTITKGEGTFFAKGTHTVVPGWHEYYGRHVKLEEQTLPPVEIGTVLSGEVETVKKMTQPPRRYTASSIIKELESRGLGTKATRAEIIENLYERGYVEDTSITASELGLITVQTLEKYAPEILDEQLTREIEEELEKIRSNEVEPSAVLAHAKKHLLKTLERFKKHEVEIGTELLEAERQSQDKRNTLGPCTCGGTLQIRKGRFGRFVGCTLYPECKNTYKLPQKGMLKPAGKLCPACSFPIVLLGRREYCINMACPAKPEPEKPVSSLCPRCSKPLSLRSSFYGQFWGCSGYPHCRYVEAKAKEPEENDEKDIE